MSRVDALTAAADAHETVSPEGPVLPGRPPDPPQTFWVPHSGHGRPWRSDVLRRSLFKTQTHTQSQASRTTAAVSSATPA